MAARYRLWRAGTAGRALLFRCFGACKRRRQDEADPSLLSARLLDVVERRQARAASGIHERDLVSGGHRGLVGGKLPVGGASARAAGVSASPHCGGDRPRQRTEPLLDQHGRLADIGERAPPILEDARIPLHAAGQIRDFLLIAVSLGLHGVQRLDLGPDPLRHILLFVSVAFKPGNNRIAFAVQAVENAGHYESELGAPLLFIEPLGVIFDGGLSLIERRAPLGGARDQSCDFRVASPVLIGVDRRPGPDAGKRDGADLRLPAGPVGLLTSARPLSRRARQAEKKCGDSDPTRVGERTAPRTKPAVCDGSMPPSRTKPAPRSRPPESCLRIMRLQPGLPSFPVGLAPRLSTARNSVAYQTRT